MKGRVAVAVVLLGAAAICVRLGFWQLSRLREKRVNVVPTTAATDPATE